MEAANLELVDPELSQFIYGKMQALASDRVENNESSVFNVLDFDPGCEYHDLANKRFAAKHDYPVAGLKILAELILNEYEPNNIKPGLPEYNRLVGGLWLPARGIKSRIEAGRKVALVTAHQTRFEPALVPFLMQDAMTDSEEEHDAMRDKTNIIIARYLGCFGFVLAKIMSNPDAPSPNAIDVISQVGNILTVYPNTSNSREKSGIPISFQSQYNAEMDNIFAEIETGSLAVFAGPGTMGEEELTGTIGVAKRGTRCLPIRHGWDVVPVASILSGSSKFSIIDEAQIVDAEDVNEDTVHEAMEWIAKTRAEKGFSSTYNRS